MTDEIQRTSPAPWLIGGAAVGGTGAGVALTKIEKLKEWTTEPKYASHEDILKEKHDTLVKQAEEASEESKNVWDEIVKGHKEIEDAEATWETQKNEYVKNNSVAKPVEDTEEIKNLNKKLEELKTELAEGEKTTKTTKTVTERVSKQDYVNHQIKELKTKNAAREKVFSLKEEMSSLQAKLDNLNKQKTRIEIKIPDSNRYTSRNIERLKDSVTQLNELIDNEVARLSNHADHRIPRETLRAEEAINQYIDKLVCLNKTQKNALKKQCEAELKKRVPIVKQEQIVKTKLNSVTHEYNRIPELTRQKYEKHPDVMKNKIAQTNAEIVELNKAKELQAKRKKHVSEWWEYRQLKKKKNNDLTVGESELLSKYKGKEYQSFTDTLNADDKRIFNKYNKMQKGGKTRVEEVLTRAMTDEQIAAKQKEIADVTADIASKREALPKQVVKTAEELATEYATKNPKEAFVKTTTENVTNRLKDSLEQAMKETTKRNGLKFWGPIAGAAVGLGLLAAAIRPKTKSQA